MFDHVFSLEHLNGRDIIQIAHSPIVIEVLKLKQQKPNFYKRDEKLFFYLDSEDPVAFVVYNWQGQELDKLHAAFEWYSELEGCLPMRISLEYPAAS